MAFPILLRLFVPYIYILIENIKFGLGSTAVATAIYRSHRLVVKNLASIHRTVSMAEKYPIRLINNSSFGACRDTCTDIGTCMHVNLKH